VPTDRVEEAVDDSEPVEEQQPSGEQQQNDAEREDPNAGNWQNDFWNGYEEEQKNGHEE